MNADSVTPWPSIDVDKAAKAFHQHVFSPLSNASDNTQLTSLTDVTQHTAPVK
jgi:hypothetical protein